MSYLIIYVIVVLCSYASAITQPSGKLESDRTDTQYQRCNMDHIIHKMNGLTVQQRIKDGYINATALAKAYETATGTRKDVRDWLLTDRAKAYIAYLSEKTGIPVFDLVQIKQGRNGGTWLHPKLAIPFATWLSIEFEFQVSEWVEEWLATGAINALHEKTRTEGKVTRRQLTDAKLARRLGGRIVHRTPPRII